MDVVRAIQGISPLLPASGSRASADLHGVFAAEFSRQQDSDSDSREESRRGLEGEDEDEIFADAEHDVPPSGLNLIA